MSGIVSVQATNAPMTQEHAWAVLNAERQDVCGALNAGALKAYEREEMQRLSQIDRAMDSLMDGHYGQCMECGAPIEPDRLASDPALAVCYLCQTGLELEHRVKK